MTFTDLELSRRLERAEGHACAMYAEARQRLFPGDGTEWFDRDGVVAVCDGADSPITQTFGLGLFAAVDEPRLEMLERFFAERGAPVQHEVSPFAGVPALELLCRRGYRPIETSSVMYRLVDDDAQEMPSGITVRAIAEDEGQVWADVSTRGWTHEQPELEDFLRAHGSISTARRDSHAFLAELDGIPGAAGVLCLHERVALFGGAATVPELRRRGLQSALLRGRMRHAREHGCDIAMMVAAPGSNSQRNAERAGFRVAYTRIKWRLDQNEP